MQQTAATYSLVFDCHQECALKEEFFFPMEAA
jgi:hypothetical protein